MLVFRYHSPLNRMNQVASIDFRTHLMDSKSYLGNPNNTIKADGLFFHDGTMFVYSSPRPEGYGKPKPCVFTIAGRVLSSSNNTGMTGNYVSSKAFAKSGKRTALLGRPYLNGMTADWDTSISNLKDIISRLTNGDGHDVSYLWQDDDADKNDGAVRFGSPLFQALKPGEARDASIAGVVPVGKENSEFWKDAVEAFTFTEYPAFDINGKKIANKDVQCSIEGATVALDVIIRGWKFKTDKKWGFALDLKRLSVIAPAEDDEEVELPPLPSSQESTASTTATDLSHDGAGGPQVKVKHIITVGDDHASADAVGVLDLQIRDSGSVPHPTTNKPQGMAPIAHASANNRSMTRSANKREGSPLLKANKVAKLALKDGQDTELSIYHATSRDLPSSGSASFLIIYFDDFIGGGEIAMTVVRDCDGERRRALQDLLGLLLVTFHLWCSPTTYYSKLLLISPQGTYPHLQWISTNAFNTIALNRPQFSILTGAHPASYVREVKLGSDLPPIKPGVLRAGIRSLDYRVSHPILRSLSIRSTSAVLSDIFPHAPQRLTPAVLRFQCPLLGNRPRNCISILRTLVSNNLVSLSLDFTGGTYQRRDTDENHLFNMLKTILPKLLNVSSFALSLNTQRNTVKSFVHGDEPAAGTLAFAFESGWMVMPALRSCSLQDTTFHVSIVSLIARHPFLSTLHLYFANFDLLPIPDLVTGGSLPFLREFSGSLANVNTVLEHWQTPVSVITVIGGRSSEHEFHRFQNVLHNHVDVRTLSLSENNGYTAAEVCRLLKSFGNLTSLSFKFNCSIWAEREQWEDTVLACINIENLTDLNIHLFISEAQAAQHCCMTAVNHLLSTNDVRKNFQPLKVVFSIPVGDVYSVTL
ncbi:hypothetical protein F5877DRAFT_70526 [Lentinula edodes]|nr:hypothetical protein F5877DRAFT_70526 [Lentinula edodes]